MDEGLIILGVILVGIIAAVYFFYQTFGIIGFVLIGVAIVGWKTYKVQKEEARKREIARQADIQEAERQAQQLEARRQQHLREQDDVGRKIVECRNSAVTAYHLLPHVLINAEKQLDNAEINFRDKAFSPFWQCIEDALVEIAKLEDFLDRINWQSTSYLDLCIKYEQTQPIFPIANGDTKKIRNACLLTEDRIQSIVSKAQRVYEFASIFEQRRTTSVLIKGFSNLGQAINGLRAQVEQSFDSLSSQLDHIERGLIAGHSDLVDVVQLASMEQANAINRLSAATESSTIVSGVALKQAGEQRVKIAKKQEELAERQLAMLDNIQRHRKPLDRERGNRRF